MQVLQNQEAHGPRFAHLIKKLLHICTYHATSSSVVTATSGPYRKKRSTVILMSSFEQI